MNALQIIKFKGGRRGERGGEEGAGERRGDLATTTRIERGRGSLTDIMKCMVMKINTP